MKKWISFILALVLLCSAAPLMVFPAQAAGTGPSRAEWIQSLVETFSMTVEEDNYPDNYFSDLTGEEEYYRDILVAVEFGVVDIEAGLPFLPDEPVTREFAAQTLNFCLGFQLDEEAEYTFNEAASAVYPSDIQIAINRGWFSLTNGAFLPNQAVTAEEAAAMLADAQNILKEDIVDENYDNAFVFSDDVIELPESTAVQVNSSTELLLASPTAKIAEGDIFAVYFDGLPTIYEADAVAVSGSLYTITVTKLELYDYLKSVDAEGTMTGNLADFEVSEELDALYILEDGTQVADARAAGTKKIKEIYFYQQFGDLKVSINLTDMKLDWKAQGNVLDKTSINVSAVVSGNTYCSVTVPFGVSASDFTKNLTLGTYPIGNLGYVTVTANISIDGSVTVSYGANFKAGVSYSYYEGFRIPHSFQKTHFSLTVEATLNAGITVKASIYEVPFLDAQCSASVGMKANFVARYRGDDKTPALCIHTDSWIYAKVGASASVGIDAPKIPGADSFKKEWSVTVDIWDRNTSPVRSISHFEDGSYVTSCSYGETDFFGYNSYYYSGYGSRYSNGGVSAIANIPTYTYTTDEDGNATITGYNGGFASLSIPATIDGHPVTAIGANAFKGQKYLVSVTLPKGVVSIGESAFKNCVSLKSISLPDGLSTIGTGAFYGCVSLIEVTLPDSMTVLGCSAFQNCTGLQRVYIPMNMKTGEHCGANHMYPGPFAGCSKLTNIDFAEGITSIPSALFLDCTGLEGLDLPDTITAINHKAFAGCTKLSTVSFSESLTHIWNDAFAGCTALTDIVLPDTMEIIGCGAFQNCTMLQHVYIPKNMTTGDNCGANYQYPGPFANCESLNDVTFAEGITRIPNALFISCSGLKSITIPDTVTSINYKAFGSCVNLTEVNLPNSLTVIGNSAFADSTGLQSVAIPTSVTTLSNYAFSSCTGLTEMELPASLKTLGCGAFQYCSNLQKINIPKGVKTGEHCGANNQYPGPFKECSALTEVTFDEGFSSMPYALFWNCTGLKSVTLPDTLKNISGKAFEGCTSLEEIIIPDSITEIGARAFQYTALLEITIPDSVVNTGDHILADCSKLKTITWSAGTKTIRDYSFSGSVSVETVNLPDTVTTLQKGVFRDCDALKTVTLPSSITSMGSETFYDCDVLQQIIIPDSVTSIGSHCFYGCDMLKDVTLSRNLTSIPASAFQQCALLEEITVPYYVTSIGNNAFNSSPKLTKVVLPRNLTSIGTTAFSYANTTVIYGVPDTFAETWANENGFRFVANEVTVTEVSLVKTELTLNKGASETLVLNIQPENFTDIITWKSSDEKVVTVSDKGALKAVGVGTATIKVTVGSKNASCKVTVVQPVTSINLNKSSVSLEGLETFQLKATVKPDSANNKEIAWTSSDPAVATVDATGLVTAVAKGSATITAEAQDGSGVTKTCAVTVTNTGTIAQVPSDLGITGGYPADCTDFWLYTASGAASLKVTFDEQTQLEDGFDYLYIYDADDNEIGKYTGTELAGLTITVPGDTVKLQLQTDSSTDTTSEWGFQVTQIVASHDGGEITPPIEDDDPTTPTEGEDPTTPTEGEDPTTPTEGEDPISNPFQDVADDAFYYDAVLWAVDEGVTNGLSATAFGPDVDCNRGQVVTFLWRAAGSPEPTNKISPFTDVADPGAFYYKAVLWAVEKGITTGLSSTSFGPDVVCNRGQVVTFLNRYFDSPSASSTRNPFTDVKSSDFFYQAVLWANEENITNGYGSSTTFCPDVSCNRGQIVTFLYRAIN